MAEEKKDDQLTIGLLNMDNYFFTCSTLKNIIIRDGAWYIEGTDIPLDQTVVKRCGYYLPDDLTHYTNKVFYGRDWLSEDIEINLKKLKNIIGKSKDTFSNVTYYQDPFIQLFNASTNTYVNFINKDMVQFDYKFICISDTCNYERRGDKIQFFKNDIVNVPWGWNLKGGEIQKTSVIQISSIRDDENRFFTEEKGEKLEQSKGGNFISAPFGTVPGISYIFTVTGASPGLLSQIRGYPLCDIIELECSFKAYGKAGGFRHIDELMCFMPYGLTDTKRIFKVWFYDELDSNSFGNLLIKNDKLGIKNKTFNSLENKENKDAYLELVNKERMENLDKISNKLFGSNYDSNQDKFIFFKLDLNLPSIFNRVWIERDKTICLFGQNSENPVLKEKVNLECRNLISWLNPDKPIEIHWISVIKANSEKPEGSVHCGIKQRLGNISSMQNQLEEHSELISSLLNQKSLSEQKHIFESSEDDEHKNRLRNTVGFGEEKSVSEQKQSEIENEDSNKKHIFESDSEDDEHKNRLRNTVGFGEEKSGSEQKHIFESDSEDDEHKNRLRNTVGFGSEQNSDDEFGLMEEYDIRGYEEKKSV